MRTKDKKEMKVERWKGGNEMREKSNNCCETISAWQNIHFSPNTVHRTQTIQTENRHKQTANDKGDIKRVYAYNLQLVVILLC